jgi:predicted peptidase
MLKYLLIILLFTGCYNYRNIKDFNAAEYTKEGYTLRYRILYPPNYNPQQKYPVITFLHGGWERGSDNCSQLKHGGGFFADDLKKKVNSYIVVFPQCPWETMWRDLALPKDSMLPNGQLYIVTATKPSAMVKLLLDSLQKSNIADPDRMYLGGISIGGVGTYDLMQRYPNYFAAIFPVCGVGDTSGAHLFAKTLSFWIFHGEKDPIIDVKYSRAYFKRLQAAGADAKYTEYKNVGHSSWDYVFKNKKLIPWILSKRRKPENSSTQ